MSTPTHHAEMEFLCSLVQTLEINNATATEVAALKTRILNALVTIGLQASGGQVTALPFDLTTTYIFEDFVTGDLGTSPSIGLLRWSSTGGSTAGIRLANHPGIIQLNKTSAGVGAIKPSNASGTIFFDPGSLFSQRWIISPQANTNESRDIRFGLTSDWSNTAANDGIYFEKLSADTNWFAVTRAGGSQTRVDTTVAFTAANWYRMIIARSGSSINFTIGSTTVNSTLTIPTAFLDIFAQVNGTAADGANHFYYIDFMDMYITTLTR